MDRSSAPENSILRLEGERKGTRRAAPRKKVQNDPEYILNHPDCRSSAPKIFFLRKKGNVENMKEGPKGVEVAFSATTGSAMGLKR